MSTVYITEQNTVVRQSDRHLVVTKEKERIKTLPLIKVDSLLLFGNVHITREAINLLAAEGIDVAFLTQNGRLQSRLVAKGSKNVFLRLAQYERHLNDQFQLELARTIVKSKLRNGRAFILFYQKNHREGDFSEELATLDATLKRLDDHAAVPSLLGAEGIGTAAYFKAYGKMFTRELRFEKRTRRPPKDPVNALLSLGYTLLTNEIEALLVASGFDVYIGFLHGIEYGRPSLALDLVEEFRHPFIDRFTLNLINNKMLTINDFQPGRASAPGEAGAVWLTDPARKKYFELYAARLCEPLILEESNAPTTFRDLMRRQVDLMARTIKHNEPYKPFRMRW